MYKLILNLSLPIIMSQSIQMIMILTDRYILSLKNPLFTSAATTGGFTALSICSFFIHFLLFSTSLIAKKFGKNDLKKCHIIAMQGILIAICSTPILLIITRIGYFYFAFLGHPVEYLTLENDYFSIIMLSYIVILFRTVLESYFLGINNSKVIFYSSLIGILINMPLTYLFVLGQFSSNFKGLSGAAWGTFYANGFSLLFMIFQYLKNIDHKYLKISWNEIFQGSDLFVLLKQGAYTGFEKFINSFCFVCFVNMFVFYGKEVSTAISIVFSWDQIAFLPIIGMYSALMSLYSRFLGQGNNLLANISLHSSLKIIFSLMFVLSILFWTLSNKFTQIFLSKEISSMNTELVYYYSNIFLQTTCFYIFANATIFLYKAALRSMGLSGWCFRFSLIVHSLLVVCSYSGVYIFKSSPLKIWFLFLIMLTILSVTFVLKYYKTYLKISKKVQNA